MLSAASSPLTKSELLDLVSNLPDDKTQYVLSPAIVDSLSLNEQHTDWSIFGEHCSLFKIEISHLDAENRKAAFSFLFKDLKAHWPVEVTGRLDSVIRKADSSTDPYYLYCVKNPVTALWWVTPDIEEFEVVGGSTDVAEIVLPPLPVSTFSPA